MTEGVFGVIVFKSAVRNMVGLIMASEMPVHYAIGMHVVSYTAIQPSLLTPSGTKMFSK